MPRKALVFGATGLVGRQLTTMLVRDPAWDEVICVVRRQADFGGEPVTQVIAEPSTIDQVAAQLAADVVFCCLGTTQKTAGGREGFRRIDRDYVLKCAALARRQGATRLLLVSSVGAKVGSSSFYAHVKGETERDVAQLGYPSVDILRPSLLLGERNERRLREEIGGRILSRFRFLFIGPLRNFRPISAAQVARAMMGIAQSDHSGVLVHAGDALEGH